MSKRRSNWRKLFSKEYKRCDYNCEEILINNLQFRLVKYEDNIQCAGKWLLFDSKENFIGRCSSPTPPTDWADNLVDKELK
jgi:hypothetical protein